MKEFETEFERFAPAIAAFFVGGYAVPLGFGAVVLTGGSPVTVDTYGPLVYAIPALYWVGAQILILSVAFAGALLMRPRLAAVGAVMVGLLMAFFAGAAVLAGAGGSILVFGAGGWVAPLSFVAAAVAWRGRNVRR